MDCSLVECVRGLWDFLCGSAPIIGSLASTLVAIYVMLRTAREVRLTYVHEAMCKCLAHTLGLVRLQLDLLGDISRKVVYRNFSRGVITETAYDRYWNKIDLISKDFSELIPEQRLFLHKEVYESLTILVDLLNDANGLAKGCKPDDRHAYPNTSELVKTVEKAATAYRVFVNQAREFIGADELTKISSSKLSTGEEELDSVGNAK